MTWTYTRKGVLKTSNAFHQKMCLVWLSIMATSLMMIFSKVVVRCSSIRCSKRGYSDQICTHQMIKFCFEKFRF